jgi:hypothetical protein
MVTPIFLFQKTLTFKIFKKIINILFLNKYCLALQNFFKLGQIVHCTAEKCLPSIINIFIKCRPSHLESIDKVTIKKQVH